MISLQSMMEIQDHPLLLVISVEIHFHLKRSYHQAMSFWLDLELPGMALLEDLNCSIAYQVRFTVSSLLRNNRKLQQFLLHLRLR